jgi:superfamily I DNA/RNA helicase
VRAWLNADSGDDAGGTPAKKGQTPRALCLLAGAGTGKSTVSAALVDLLKDQGVVAAHHFLNLSSPRIWAKTISSSMAVAALLG